MRPLVSEYQTNGEAGVNPRQLRGTWSVPELKVKIL